MRGDVEVVRIRRKWYVRLQGGFSTEQDAVTQSRILAALLHVAHDPRKTKG